LEGICSSFLTENCWTWYDPVLQKGRMSIKHFVERLEGRVLLSAQVVGEYAYRPVFGASVGYDLAVQEDEKIVGVGTTMPVAGDRDVLVMRYVKEGWYDDSFGAGGLVGVHLSAEDQGLAVATWGESIVAAGTTVRNGKTVGLLLSLKSDGTLDPSFGSNGIVTFSADRKFTRFRDVATDDRGVVVAGSAGSDVLVARFTWGGALDGTFSGDGYDRKDLGGEERGQGMALGKGGRVTVCGMTQKGKARSDMAVLRYRANGELDTRFSRDGVQVMDYGEGDDCANAVQVDGAGRIVVAGAVTWRGWFRGAVTRLSASGRVDTGYGSDGWFVQRRGDTEINALALRTNGTCRIGGGVPNSQLAARGRLDARGRGKFAVVEHSKQQIYGMTSESQGAVASAGGEDFVSYSFNYQQRETMLDVPPKVREVFVQPNGKAVILGWERNELTLRRLNEDGTLDASFGRGGMVGAGMPVNLSPTDPAHLYVEWSDLVRSLSDGSFVVVGETAPLSQEGIVLMHFTADGRLDTTYGDHGIAWEFLTDSFVNDLVVQPDGKVVMAVGISPNLAWFLMRFNRDGSEDQSLKLDEGEIEQQLAKLGTHLRGEAVSVAVSDGGTIWISGTTVDGVFDSELRSDGSLDTRFGNGGVIAQVHGSDYHVPDPLGRMQRDGTFIYVNPDGGVQSRSVDVVKHRADGSLDLEFGMKAHAVVDLGSEGWVQQASMQADGKILLVGSRAETNGTSALVVRLNANGSRDLSFGGGDGMDLYGMGKDDTIARVQVDDRGVMVVIARHSDEGVQRWTGVKFSVA
jgi:uncharacterized delta-60 repeat protein